MSGIVQNASGKLAGAVDNPSRNIGNDHDQPGRLPVSCRALTADDAKAIAELERATYPDTLRSGARQLRADLEIGAWEASNLSFGLFSGSELVGFMLIFYEEDCRLPFAYFGLTPPVDLGREECMYVADFVVRRDHRQHMPRLVKAVVANLGPSYERLPWYGFSTPDVLARWQTKRRAARRVGLRYVGQRTFALETAPHQLAMVRFEVSPPPLEVARNQLAVKTVTTISGWNSLEADWDALLHRTPDGTAFQSFALQKIWWKHLSRDGWPLILVAYQGARVRAIAPLWIQTTRYFGIRRRLVKFIGDHSEVDRPTILRNGHDDTAVRAILDYLLAHTTLWDAAMLHEQPHEGLVISHIRALAPARPVLTAVVAGPSCPWVDLRGSWNEFLASRSSNFRKSLKRRLRQLQTQGEVVFRTYETWPEVLQGFESFLQVEARSWKGKRGIGVARNSKSLAYHTDMLYAFGLRRQLHVRTLAVAGQPIAATFGLVTDGRFLSLHIAHDPAYGHFSPGVLLTAYELEEAYGRADYAEYEFLGGFLDNKMSWTSAARETQQVFLYRRDTLFLLHHAWHFRFEPWMKRWLKRLGLHATVVRLRDRVNNMLRGGALPADD